MKKFSVALKIRPKHGTIFNYMAEHGLSAIRLAQEIGLSPQTMNQILNFKWTPKKSKHSQAIADKLTSFFNCSIADLFPEELRKEIENRTEIAQLLQNEHVISKEVDLHYLDFKDLARLEGTAYDQETEKNILADELRTIIDGMVNTLETNEQKIIRMYFGLSLERSYSSSEIAEITGMQPEKIVSLVNKIIRKFRKHRKKKNLAAFLPDYEIRLGETEKRQIIRNVIKKFDLGDNLYKFHLVIYETLDKLPIEKLRYLDKFIWPLSPGDEEEMKFYLDEKIVKFLIETYKKNEEVLYINTWRKPSWFT